MTRESVGGKTRDDVARQRHVENPHRRVVEYFGVLACCYKRDFTLCSINFAVGVGRFVLVN